jgi:hypothetical protein
LARAFLRLRCAVSAAVKILVTIICYTFFVQHESRVIISAMKNLTITVEESALTWARIEAAKRNTSVSRLVGDMLAEKMRASDAYRRAAEEWRSKVPTWRSDGAAYTKRDELYDRSL